MEIIIKKTSEFSASEWKNYTNAFNSVFSKSIQIKELKHKYFKTIDHNSYHSLLFDDNKIVGGFTIIPFEYFFNNDKIKIGLAVDVFILEKYRKNPLLLYKIYTGLKKEVKDQGVIMNVGIPNNAAYLYWKNILKWKDIGSIPYYILPIKIGTVVNRFKKVLNPLNCLFAKALIKTPILRNKQESFYPIRIDKENPIVEEHRYINKHKKIRYKDIFFRYCITNESGIKACYLIDFYNKNKRRDKKTLKYALNYIVKNTDIDIIIFVGKLKFTQHLLFKVPNKYEPKHLYFTGDIVDQKLVSNEFVFNFTNWDFGLFNYDVR